MILAAAIAVLPATRAAHAIEQSPPQQSADWDDASVLPQTGASSVESTVFSPDGRLLATAGANSIKIWEVSTRKESRSIKCSDEVHALAFSPKGDAILAAGDVLQLWDVNTGRQLRDLGQGKSGLLTVAFAPDGRHAATGGYDGSLVLWDVETGRRRQIGAHGRRRSDETIQAVAYSPDGRLILSGAESGDVALWDAASGAELGHFMGHMALVHTVAFSPDGRRAVSGSWDGAMMLWDVNTGSRLKVFMGRIVEDGRRDFFNSAAFLPGGRYILSSSVSVAPQIWDTETGREVLSFSGDVQGVTSIALSPDGRIAAAAPFFLSVKGGEGGNTIRIWDTVTGKELRGFSGQSNNINLSLFSPDGRYALAGGSEDDMLTLWEMDTGKELRRFGKRASRAAFSPDSRFVLASEWRHVDASPQIPLSLWDIASGREVRKFGRHGDSVSAIAFSPDGRMAYASSYDGMIKAWDVASGAELLSTPVRRQTRLLAFSSSGARALADGCQSRPYNSLLGCDAGGMMLLNTATGAELRTFTGHAGDTTAAALSEDGRLAVSGGFDHTLKLWDVGTGKELRRFAGHSKAITSVQISRDNRFILSSSKDGALKLWDVSASRELRSFTGHTDQVNTAVFSPDGRFALSGSRDASARIWNIATGKEAARLMTKLDGEWLTVTPEGFFVASRRDTDLLSVVRGGGATSIGQMHQSLFNPDLVREALAGDPDGEVRRAAKAVNINMVLDAGPPPEAEITSHTSGSRSANALVTAAARISSRGKGIGRIEWRVNGVTAGVTTAPANAGAVYDVRQELALDSGENEIEVIAYEGRNLLASPPARVTIRYDGPQDTVRPKLHILVIGVNAYVDQGWTPPGETEKLAFPPLTLAVTDAQAFAAEMRKAGAGLYSEVRIMEALDADASLQGLGRQIEQAAASISPRDTFVLYAAAHGYSVNGRYYLIPQDYQGGVNQEALKTRAVSQELLQSWIANRIKAKKALILLDTCESGALVSGVVKSRSGVPASEAAIGRLHEATGRPVLTAAAEGKPAFEGYKGHGVFTYALIDALHKGDANNNGQIELSELAAYTERRVPELAKELHEYGGVVKGIAITAMRGAKGSKQSAHFGSTGEDFTLAARLP